MCSLSVEIVVKGLCQEENRENEIVIQKEERKKEKEWKNKG